MRIADQQTRSCTTAKTSKDVYQISLVMLMEQYQLQTEGCRRGIRLRFLQMFTELLASHPACRSPAPCQKSRTQRLHCACADTGVILVVISQTSDPFKRYYFGEMITIALARIRFLCGSAVVELVPSFFSQVGTNKF